MPVDPYWVETVGRVSLLPVLHGRVEFCRAVRQAVRSVSPEVIALELPRGLEEPFKAAVARFPQLSFLTQAEFSESGAESAAGLWRIEPTDPFCEAVRSAAELEIPVVFVDDMVTDYPSGTDRLPDPYLVTGLGLEAYYKECRKILDLNPKDRRDSIDLGREQKMANRLSFLARQRRVLFIGGLKHCQPIVDLLQDESTLGDLEPPAPPLPCQIFHPSQRTVRSLSDEIPFVMSLYEFQRGGPGDEKFWLDPTPDAPEPEPEKKKEEPALSRDSVFGSLEQLLGMKVSPEVKDLTETQLRRLNAYLNSMKPESWMPPSFDEPAEEEPAVAPPADGEGGLGRFFTFKNSEHRRAELKEKYERINTSTRTATGALDRQQVYRALVELAATYYEENTGETFKPWQHKNFNAFVRRYAHLQGKLLPGLLPLIYGSRSCVDHNYAYEFWDLATFYPWQTDESDAPIFDFDGENLEIDGMKMRHFEFNRTFPRMRQSFKPMPFNDRQVPTDDPKDWSGAFESGRICSYPPEDLVIEDYGRYLQKKAIKVQSDAHSRTEPFTTSLLDGIDMRTTLRNWADGQKLYVREEKKIHGGTGSVVLIFDDDEKNQKYPWCITWHGEHDQESDMGFYATDRRKKVIGPGIARCEYGGLMLSYPPRRLANIWGDPHYQGAKTKAEVLLYAAIDYCEDKHILYVADKSPRSYFFGLAQRLGKKLVYLPIGTLSPTSLERIRVFHVLAGHRYREIAKDFVW